MQAGEREEMEGGGTGGYCGPLSVSAWLAVSGIPAVGKVGWEQPFL